MTNPTSNFNWQMPEPTDLVTNLPADFEVFGQAVDSDFADLLGGTTGQVLSKTSNTDLDFTWVAANPGDITEVTVSSPITGGGSSGSVNVAIQDGTTAQKGAVQLENSTSSTSTTTAAVPANVKTSYDLAAAAIPKSTVTTNGDLIYGTGSAAVTRLGIGSAGNVLTVASGVPSWAAPAGGGKVLQVVQGTYTSQTTNTTTSAADTNLTVTITPSLNTSKVLIIVCHPDCAAYRAGGSTENYGFWTLLRSSTQLQRRTFGQQGYNTTNGNMYGAVNFSYLDNPATTSATTYKTQFNLVPGSGTTLTIEGSGTIINSIIAMEIGA